MHFDAFWTEQTVTVRPVEKLGTRCRTRLALPTYCAFLATSKNNLNVCIMCGLKFLRKLSCLQLEIIALSVQKRKNTFQNVDL